VFNPQPNPLIPHRLCRRSNRPFNRVVVRLLFPVDNLLPFLPRSQPWFPVVNPVLFLVHSLLLNHPLPPLNNRLLFLLPYRRDNQLVNHPLIRVVNRVFNRFPSQLFSQQGLPLDNQVDNHRVSRVVDPLLNLLPFHPLHPVHNRLLVRVVSRPPNQLLHRPNNRIPLRLPNPLDNRQQSPPLNHLHFQLQLHKQRSIKLMDCCSCWELRQT
jgi:hypothetical protein